VRCIVTSRSGAFDHLAKITNLDQWSDQVAADYLLSRTERKDNEGALRLAHALGGLPLAAEQAAVHLRPRVGTSFDDYAADVATLIKRPKPKGAVGGYPDTVYAAFAKSLEVLNTMEGCAIALDLLRLCAFLSPDGVELRLLLADEGGKALPASFAKSMSDKYVREDALAALVSLSLLRREEGPPGPVLIFHRLLLDVVRDWMGADARVAWGAAAAQIVDQVFPSGPNGGKGDPSTDTSIWSICARLMPHVAPLDTHAPRKGAAGRSLGRLLNQASLYLSVRGDRTGALALAEKSVALTRATRADEPLLLAAALNNLARRYSDLDRLDEAETTYREALAIEEPLLPPDDPDLAITLSNLAGVHGKRKQFANAEPLFLRAAEIMKGAHGEESAEYGTLLSNLGQLYGEWADRSGNVGKREQERHYTTRAVAVTQAARGARHPSTGTRHSNLAVMKAHGGDWKAASLELERAVAIMLSLDLAQHPNTQRRVGALIDFWRQSRQPEKAARLEAGDISDLLPVIAQIEGEHRAWVAKDPKNRDFGPPSPFAKQ
jgi:tetratricopeptide (TPR) repeat protein